MKELLTYQEVQDITGIPMGTLYCLVHKRKIPHVRLGPRTVRFKGTDINTWLTDGYQPKEEPKSVEQVRGEQLQKLKARISEESDLCIVDLLLAEYETIREEMKAPKKVEPSREFHSDRLKP